MGCETRYNIYLSAIATTMQPGLILQKKPPCGRFAEGAGLLIGRG